MRVYRDESEIQARIFPLVSSQVYAAHIRVLRSLHQRFSFGLNCRLYVTPLRTLPNVILALRTFHTGGNRSYCFSLSLSLSLSECISRTIICISYSFFLDWTCPSQCLFKNDSFELKFTSGYLFITSLYQFPEIFGKVIDSNRRQSCKATNKERDTALNDEKVDAFTSPQANRLATCESSRCESRPIEVLHRGIAWKVRGPFSASYLVPLSALPGMNTA